jgi:hypothetical protein
MGFRPALHDQGEQQETDMPQPLARCMGAQMAKGSSAQRCRALGALAERQQLSRQSKRD